MDGNMNVALATASFVGTHLVLSHPLRAPLVRRIGEKGFLGLYSLVAALTLGWLVYAMFAAPAEAPLWVAPPGLWHGAGLVMLIAAIMLLGSLVGNPALPDPTGTPRFPDRAKGLLAITRHPMMWSFMLWALVHATLWPTPANLILTGGIFTLSLLGALGQDAKKARLIGAPWRAWQRKTSFLPFAALLAGRASWRDAWPGAIATVGGLALWLGATWLHPLPVGPWLWLG